MKIAKYLTLGLMATTLIVSCGETKAEETKVEEIIEHEVVIVQTNFNVDTAQSVINYKGYEGFTEDAEFHSGTLKVLSGTITLTESDSEGMSISNGDLVIDMNSIVDNDGLTKLQNHLKTVEFFNVEEFATAEFHLTRHENDEITGTLSLLGQELDVVAPVTFEKVGDVLTITAEEFRLDVAPVNMPFFVAEVENPEHDSNLGISITLVANK